MVRLRHATPSVFHQRHLWTGAAIIALGTTDDELHRYWAESLAQADALLFWPGNLRNDGGRVEAAGDGKCGRIGWPSGWTPSPGRSTRPRSTSCRAPWEIGVDWNAELVRGDLETAVQQLKEEPGMGLFVGGVTLPLTLAELGLIDEYEFAVQPRIAGHGRHYSQGSRRILT